MAGFTHLVVVGFNDEAVAEEIVKGLEKLVSEIGLIKSFVWGKDTESMDILRQGHTHAFIMNFDSRDDYNAFQIHPKRFELADKLKVAVDKVVLLDFPTVTVKAPTV